MKPLWEAIRGMLDMAEIEAFADRLIEAGNSHHAAELAKYARNLREYVHNFDITKVKRSLREFPEIVDRLKESARSHPEIPDSDVRKRIKPFYPCPPF